MAAALFLLEHSFRHIGCDNVDIALLAWARYHERPASRIVHDGILLLFVGGRYLVLALFTTFWQEKREVRRLSTIQNMPILGVFSHFSPSAQL